MNPLQPPDSHHLSAAVGWLGLGNWQEANEELEKIAPALRAHPDVLGVRFEVYAKAQQWDLAAEASSALIKLDPKKPQLWISYAYATRRMDGGGIARAKQILAQARQMFPKEPIIYYNLACYECQLGNLKTARSWLEDAFAIGGAERLKLMALHDPDLEPLRAQIAEI